MKPATILLLLGTLCAAARADVTLPAIFGDHMVLQQGAKLTVWGWADPGEQVVVSLADQKLGVTADAEGKWSAALNPSPATGNPLDLTVAGKNTITIHDCLLGDVWVCGGDANMSLPVSQVRNYKEYMSTAGEPQIRVFQVRPRASLYPLQDCQATWVVSDVTTVRNFSGLAFLFGKQMHDATKSPIGLIGAYCDQAPAEAWTSRDALLANSQLASLVNVDLDKAMDDLPDKLAGNRQNWAAFDQSYAGWQQNVGDTYDAALIKWAAARQPGGKINNPPKPKGGAEPRPPQLDGVTTPTVLSNGMIAPLTQFAIKGVLWCDGESDVGNVNRYGQVLPALIGDWRARWGEGNIPFVVVQTSTVPPGGNGAAPGQWALLRAAQASVLPMPQVGLVSTIDIGDPKSIRANDKNTASRRAATIARHLISGDSQVSGPTFDKMTIDGSKVHIAFHMAGGGLRTPKPKTATTEDPPKGFEIAGPDKQFQPAQATIDGDGVTVWADGISQPAAVRYGWDDNPTCNLTSKEGLGVVPFRTDDW